MGKCFGLLVLTLIVSRMGYAIQLDTTQPEIQAVEFRVNTSFFGESLYRIFHVDSFVIYENQYVFDSSSAHMDTAGNMTSTPDDYQCIEKRSKFFVFHRDSSYGYFYHPDRTNDKATRLPVDSVLLSIRGSSNFNALLAKKPDSSTWNKHKTELREVYTCKAANETPAIRIRFYYTSGLNHIRESLAPELDSARRMKVYKFEYLIDEFYNKADGRLNPPINNIIELKEIKVEHPAEIMQFICNYKTSIALSKIEDGQQEN